MLKVSEANTMNQPLVESIAQTILAMSDKERQLLDSTLQRANKLPQMNEPTEDAKTFRVAEIAQGIQAFENKYSASPKPEPAEPEFDKKESFSSFFKLAQSLQLEGPPDWSSRINDYLNEDAMSTHD
jgi:hypothetical protein